MGSVAQWFEPFASLFSPTNKMLSITYESNTSVSKPLSQPQLRGVFSAANGRNWLPNALLDRDDHERSAPARERALVLPPFQRLML